MRNFAELGKRVGAIVASAIVRRTLLAIGSSILAVPSALAQSPYMPAWGSTSLPGGSSVSVNLAVLDALGPPPEVAGTPSLAHHHVGAPQTGAADGHARRAAATSAKHRPAPGETSPSPNAVAIPPVNPSARTESSGPRPTPPVGAAPVEATARDADPRDSGAEEQAAATTVAALTAPALPRAVAAQTSTGYGAAAQTDAKATPPQTPAQIPVTTQAPANGSVAGAPPATAPVQVAAMTSGRPAEPPPVAIPVAAPAAIANGATIHFATGATALAADAQPALNAFVQRLMANQDLRVQLVAYASGNDDEANQARRTSLARAIAVRTYLIDQGVRGTRIDVRALGNRSGGSEPADRVDLVVLDR